MTMGMSPKPINPRPVGGIRFHPDRAHGVWPDHMDIVKLLDKDEGLIHKLRIGKKGDILSDDVDCSSK